MADLRIVAGVVAPDASIFSGSGFKVDKTDEGLYTVIFFPEFSSVPAVNATQIYPWPMNSESHGGDTIDNAVIVFVASDRVRIKVGDNGGDPKNRAFTFMAVGL